MKRGRRFLLIFSLAAVGAGTARALTTTYLPVLLERIDDEPVLIGLVMTVNAVAGFFVPLGVGVWSDRRAAGNLGRRLPFMAGGAALAAGGLVAIALGHATSYLALALAAAVVYTGLAALATAHRTLIADDIDDERRPAVTGAQEVATAVGGAVAVVAGAALIEPSPGAAFAIGAAVLAATALPTLLLTRRRRLGAGTRASAPKAGVRASLKDALRRPGVREVLVAQTLWVFAYAALPTFFVLYARDALGLDVGLAGALPLAFGLFIALGLVVGGRTAPERVHPRLLTGAALLGSGLLAASATSNLAGAALPLAAAGLGAGLLTTLGFPYFARFVPAGEEGAYSGIFFAGRGVASAAALPLAGGAAQLTGTYRTVLWMGAAAIAALIPLVRAERAAARQAVAEPSTESPASVAAVIPVFTSDRAAEVAEATLRHVDRVVLVDDGAPSAIAASIAPLAADERVQILTLPSNGGKGGAVAAGMRELLDGPQPPDAVLVVDSDGQHDPERIPAFVEAARSADVVVGHRDERRTMPLERRAGNLSASLLLFAATRKWVPDTQNGMRLFRADALRETPVPAGGYAAESVHLRALLAAGRRVASVAIPTIYDGEPSGFRPMADTLAVARALVARPGREGPAAPDPDVEAARADLLHWPARIAAATGAILTLGLALPLVQPVDNQLFLAVNALGDGPEWLYQALDPHGRNYAILFALIVLGAAFTLRRARYVLGAALAVGLAGYAAGAILKLVNLFVDRPRPEEVLGDQVLLSHDRTWAHIASYPSGHMIVTAALVTVAVVLLPRLRWPLYAYLAAVAVTRVAFGAHFPIDVMAGTFLGHEFGLLAVTLLANARLLPARIVARQRGEPAHVPVRA
jgi:dolichol-phosphate mannosyltransferase